MKRFLAVLAIFTGLTMAAAGQEIAVTLVPGGSYARTHWFGIIPTKTTPQTAMWLETADGVFVADIFVSSRAATGSWRGSEARPEALPVWSGSRAGRAGAAGARGALSADAVSGATPKAGSYTRSYRPSSPLPAGDYVARVELNVSFDYNAAWPESAGGVNGQPSVVYAARFTVDAAGAATVTAPFAAVGRGDPSGAGGVMTADLSGLDTALDIAASLTLAVRP